jgi:plasmid stabilization system protein ParE
LRKFILESSAETDLRTAARYYDNERHGRGKEFLADFHRTIARVVEYPLAAPTIYKHVRKARLDDFLFDVLYTLKDDAVAVFAVMHRRRNPDSWKKRI